MKKNYRGISLKRLSEGGSNIKKVTEYRSQEQRDFKGRSGMCRSHFEDGRRKAHGEKDLRILESRDIQPTRCWNSHVTSWPQVLYLETWVQRFLCGFQTHTPTADLICIRFRCHSL